MDAKREAELLRIIEKQRQLIERLTALIAELEAQLAKNSLNSGKPPSSDGLKKKPAPKSERESGKRSSGGQPGHQRKTLEAVAELDEVVLHTVECCPTCAELLRKT